MGSALRLSYKRAPSNAIFALISIFVIILILAVYLSYPYRHYLIQYVFVLNGAYNAKCLLCNYLFVENVSVESFSLSKSMGIALILNHFQHLDKICCPHPIALAVQLILLDEHH